MIFCLSNLCRLILRLTSPHELFKVRDMKNTFLFVSLILTACVNRPAAVHLTSDTILLYHPREPSPCDYSGQFREPPIFLKTKKHQIRIEPIEPLKDYKYKYISWDINKSLDDAPDLIISGGRHEMQGSGGNNVYKFNHNGYSYTVYQTILGTEYSAPYGIWIEQDDKPIEHYVAELICSINE
jgi:hypothetical protein